MGFLRLFQGFPAAQKRRDLIARGPANHAIGCGMYIRHKNSIGNGRSLTSTP